MVLQFFNIVCTGLVLLLFSYDNNFYLNAVAENACLNKQELQNFMEVVTEQIDHLYELMMREQQQMDWSSVIFNNNELVDQQVTIIET